MPVGGSRNFLAADEEESTMMNIPISSVLRKATQEVNVLNLYKRKTSILGRRKRKVGQNTNLKKCQQEEK